MITHEYLQKPAYPHHQINDEYVQRMGIRALWVPDYTEFYDFPQLKHSAIADKIQPTRSYAVRNTNFDPGIAYSESGVVGTFPGGGIKNDSGFSWVVLESDNGPENSATLFGVAATTDTSNFARTICSSQLNFTMSYNGSTNKMIVSRGFSVFSETLPITASDGREHVWAAIYQPDKFPFHILMYFDGESIGGAIGPTVALTEVSNFQVGGVGFGQQGAWSGTIAMSGFAGQSWTPEGHATFALSPFEVLYPPPLRINLLVQMAARQYAGPMMGTSTHTGGLMSSRESVSPKIGGDSVAQPLLDGRTTARSKIIADPGVCTE